MNEPIATHVERNLERTGTYQLFPDRLVASVSYLMRGTAETSLPLSSLASTSTLVRVHTSLFNSSVWLLLVAVVGLAGISFFPALSQSLNVRALLYSLAVFGCAGLLLTSRRLAFVTIHGGHGEAGVTIGVGPSGQAGLEAFVAQVLQARAAASPPAA